MQRMYIKAKAKVKDFVTKDHHGDSQHDNAEISTRWN